MKGAAIVAMRLLTFLVALLRDDSVRLTPNPRTASPRSRVEMKPN